MHKQMLKFHLPYFMQQKTDSSISYWMCIHSNIAWSCKKYSHEMPLFMPIELKSNVLVTKLITSQNYIKKTCSFCLSSTVIKLIFREWQLILYIAQMGLPTCIQKGLGSICLTLYGNICQNIPSQGLHQHCRLNCSKEASLTSRRGALNCRLSPHRSISRLLSWLKWDIQLFG